MASQYIVAADVGTTGVKTCLYQVGDQLTLVDSEMEGYQLRLYPGGRAEQDPAELWAAVAGTTKRLLTRSGANPAAVKGVSFCSQMQSLILVDRSANPVRPAMSYMDQRATEELAQGFGRGLRVQGMNLRKLAVCLHLTGAAPASVKDPLWKYHWVRRNEPEAFAKVHQWLDVKDFLNLKCTGNSVMTRDSAFGTMLFDTKRGAFSEALCRMFDVNPQHLPQVISATDIVGGLTEQSATEMGLLPETPVFGGGGDASLIGIGAGAAAPGDTHIYFGTSGWVSTVVDQPVVDIQTMIASIVGATDSFNYFAELETAGKSLEWVKNHLALDEINLYLQHIPNQASLEVTYSKLYQFMLDETKDVPAGSNGVIFTPWLHGNRSPFEDPDARGMFFNISLNNGKRDLIHAVVEGVCYHLRWQLEAQRRKVPVSSHVRFVGGGALAPTTCQTLADILGRPVETVAEPQNVGALGAAIVAAVGLGCAETIEEVAAKIPTLATYYPDASTKRAHRRNYRVFTELYRRNKALFRALNAGDVT